MSLPVVDISHAHWELTTSGARSLSFSPGALCPALEEPTLRVAEQPRSKCWWWCPWLNAPGGRLQPVKDWSQKINVQFPFSLWGNSKAHYSCLLRVPQGHWAPTRMAPYHSLNWLSSFLNHIFLPPWLCSWINYPKLHTLTPVLVSASFLEGNPN